MSAAAARHEACRTGMPSAGVAGRRPRADAQPPQRRGFEGHACDGLLPWRVLVMNGFATTIGVVGSSQRGNRIDGMLNKHTNLVIPESDHLRVGDCIVDVPRREVTAPHDATPRRITIKAMQVLLVLVAHRDKVVSREALLEWVWPDTMPTDDVLTQAVAQLRKAFGDDHDAPKYLETIAKGGYRLLAPIEWVEDDAGAAASWSPDADIAGQPAQPAEEEVAAQAPETRRWWAYAVLVVALLGVAGVAAVLLRDRPSAAARTASSAPAPAPAPSDATPAAMPYQRITSQPGSEIWPSLSPDGSQVVYSAYPEGSEHATLMVQTTAPVSARAITTPPQGMDDARPVWSPDGRQIAFVRYDSKACSIMLVPASGGSARKAADCRFGDMPDLGWHPDGRHLIAGGIVAEKGGTGAIHTLDLATGRWTRLAYEKSDNDWDMMPAYSPDGRWIAFARNISLSDLWRMPAAGGKPERLTNLRTNIHGIAWTPDGNALVFGRYLDGGVRISQLDLSSRKVSDMGLPDTNYPTIAAKAPALAFVVHESRSAIYRIDLRAPGRPKERVFPSTGMDYMPSVSPDGTQLVFVSDRSARLGLWWGRIGQPDSLRLIEGIIPVPRYVAQWSADGRRLLMIGRVGSETALYEITADSGNVQLLSLPAGNPVYAEYVPGGTRMLVVADRGEGRLGLTLYDRAATPWRTLASFEDVAMTRVDAARHRILFTRPTEPGLWQAGMDLENPKRISDLPGVGGGRRLKVDADGAWLAGMGEDCSMQWDRIPAPPASKPTCLEQGMVDVVGVSLDPVNEQLYYATERDGNADLGLARLSAASPR